MPLFPKKPPPSAKTSPPAQLQPAPHSPRRSYISGIPSLWVLALILIVAAGLRFYHLATDSLWLDELYSLATTTGRFPDMSPLRTNELMEGTPHFTSLKTARPWWSIWPNMRTGRDATHPPLYIILLRWWREAFGEGEFAARSLSVVASLVAIALLFDIGRILHGPASALWAAALMAVACPQLQYAQETRPYALLLACGLGAFSSLVRIGRLGANPPRLLALGGCTLAMALTHYFSFGALITIGACVLLWLRGQARRQALLAILAAALIFTLAWGPSLWAQRHNTSFDFLKEQPAGHTVRTLARLDRLPQRFLVEQAKDQGVAGFGALLFLGTPLLLRRRPDLILPYAWLIGTAGFIAALDLARSTHHLTFIRYTLLASPGLYLILAAALSRFSNWIAHGVPVALVACCLLALPTVYDRRGEDWRGLAALIKAQAMPDEPLVFAAGSGQWLAQGLCMGLSHYVHAPSRPVVILDRPAGKLLLDRLRRSRRIWVVVEAGWPEDFLPGAKREAFREFKMAILWRVSLPQPTSSPSLR